MYTRRQTLESMVKFKRSLDTENWEMQHLMHFKERLFALVPGSPLPLLQGVSLLQRHALPLTAHLQLLIIESIQRPAIAGHHGAILMGQHMPVLPGPSQTLLCLHCS